MASDANFFFDYWRRRADFIEHVPVPEHRHEANVLAFSAFDALANLWARAFKHGTSSDRRRFGEFLVACGDCPEVFERISLPYLRWRATVGKIHFAEPIVRVLQNCGKPGGPAPDGFSEAARRCRTVNEDPTLDELLQGDLVSIANEKETKKDGRLLRDWVLDARMGEIAYFEFRCSWIHEGRPGKATHSFEMSDTMPTYLTNDYASPPRINFPLVFLVRVLRSCIDKFQREALAKQMDPVPTEHWPVLVLLNDEMESTEP